MHFDLDSHDAYATTNDDPTRLVPNPAKKKATNGSWPHGPATKGPWPPPTQPCWTWCPHQQVRRRSSPTTTTTGSPQTPAQQGPTWTQPAPDHTQELWFLVWSPGVTLTAKKITARETDGHDEVCWDVILHNQGEEIVATHDVLTLIEK